MAIRFYRKTLLSICALALISGFSALMICDAEEQPSTSSEKVVVSIDGGAVLPSFGTRAGSWFYSVGDGGSQLLLLGFPKAGVEQKPNYRLVADLNSKSYITLSIPSANAPNAVSSKCFVRNIGDVDVQVGWGAKSDSTDFLTLVKVGQELDIVARYGVDAPLTTLKIQAPEFVSSSDELKSCSVEITRFEYETATVANSLSLDPVRKEQSLDPISVSPNFRSALAEELVEWDWRCKTGLALNVNQKHTCKRLKSVSRKVGLYWRIFKKLLTILPTKVLFLSMKT